MKRKENLGYRERLTATKKFLMLALLLVFGLIIVPATALSAEDMINNDGDYYSDYGSEEAVHEAGLALNEQIAEEGFILMKNDGLLPFDGINRVTVLGRNSTDLVYGGGGSGGGDGSNAMSVFDSLEAAGFEYNPKVKSFYENDDIQPQAGGSTGGFMGGGTYYIGETPKELYTREVVDSFNLYNDAAIVVFSRTGTEFEDNPLGGIGDNDDPDRHYLSLNQNERDLLDMAKENFDNVVVVINNSAPLELGVLEDDPEINGVIWVGHPGDNGIMALGSILNGSVNPSGRTVDVYARDFTADPTYQNFGDNSQHDDPETEDTLEATGVIYGDDGEPIDANVGGFWGSGASYALMYEEGIYMGYRYYETRGYEEEQADPASTWYEDNVVYPFGYGLSYTSFDWDIVSETPVDASELAKDGSISVDVKVTNTGDHTGKDVVQLYYTAPYITGEIEKSHVELAGFAKTNPLKPGQSDVVTIELLVQDMASYDYNDANGNGHEGYELDGGNYEIKLMRNSHDVVDSIDYTIPAGGYQYTTDETTGATVENRFEGEWSSLPEDDGVTMTHMTRADFEGTFPEAPTVADMTLGATSDLEENILHVFAVDDIEASDPWYRTESDATGMTQVAEDVADEDRTFTNLLPDLSGVPKDDARWQTLLNELKYSELAALISNGGYQTAALDIIGKPHEDNLDGPASIANGNIFWVSEVVIASTWNVDLAEAQGQLIGNEALWDGVEGWYAPAMNTHRSPFSGRNFEYYSEDGFLAGKISAAVVNGAQSKGLYTFIKHYAVNDQETNRMGVLTYASEQAMREIYLEAFELPVKEGNSYAVMSAFNYIGEKSCSQNYALLTEVLRDEWGFKGVVVTDYYSGSGDGTSNYQNILEQVMVGNDIPLGSGEPSVFGSWDATEETAVYTAQDETEQESYTLWLRVRDAALNVLYVSANSNAMRNHIDFSGLGGALDDVTQFNSVNQNIVAAELGSDDYAITLAEGSELPEGLRLSEEGILSGTPTVSGSFTFSVNAAADDWVRAEETFDYTINIEKGFVFSGDALDALQEGTAFNATVDTNAFTVNPNFDDDTHDDYHVGYGSLSYSERDDSLPEGLEISSEGVISGTPTEAGEFDVTLRLTYTYWQEGGWRPGSVRQGTQDFHTTMVVAEAPVEAPTIDWGDVNISYAVGDSSTHVTENIGLPTESEGWTISWASNTPDVITDNGIVIRDAQEQIVLLTATAKQGEFTETNMYTVTVKPVVEEEEPTIDADAVDITFASGDSASAVTHHVSLPTKVGDMDIAWSSSNTDVLTNAGFVTRGEDDEDVTLTASITLGDQTETKDFTLTVLAEEVEEPADEPADTGCGSTNATTAGILVFNMLALAAFVIYRKRF